MKLQLSSDFFFLTGGNLRHDWDKPTLPAAVSADLD